MFKHYLMTGALSLLAGMMLAPGASAQELPEDSVKPIYIKMCGGCHEAEIVIGMKQNKAGWSSMVDQMISRGASGTDEEFDKVIDYLTKYFGNEAPKKVKANSATSKDFQAALELSAKEADAIVAYREKNGNFKDWHDVAKVEGVDAAKIEAKKDRLEF